MNIFKYKLFYIHVTFNNKLAGNVLKPDNITFTLKKVTVHPVLLFYRFCASLVLVNCLLITPYKQLKKSYSNSLFTTLKFPQTWYRCIQLINVKIRKDNSKKKSNKCNSIELSYYIIT